MNKYQNAIQKGKNWMKKSQNAIHDYAHAKVTTRLALKIYAELKGKGYPRLDEFKPELIEIAAWWHDAYKATVKNETLIDSFLEGRWSTNIIRKELKDDLDKDEMELVCTAVRNHQAHGVFLYNFFGHVYTPLGISLLEADALDVVSPRRHKHQILKSRFGKALEKIFKKNVKGMITNYVRTDFSKKYLKKNLG